MTQPVSEFLPPRRINLHLAANEKTEAIESVLTLLSGDPCVRDFDELRTAIFKNDAPVVAEDGCALIIAHARTESVTRLVLAVGRPLTPFLIPECPSPVILVFIAGIPGAFNSSYLRTIGSIARICKNPHDRQRLMTATTPAAFSAIIGEAGKKL